MSTLIEKQSAAQLAQLIDTELEEVVRYIQHITEVERRRGVSVAKYNWIEQKVLDKQQRIAKLFALIP